MTESGPTLREESQRETATGIIGQIQRLFDWAGSHPKRAALGALIGLPILAAALIFFLAVTMPERVADLLNTWSDDAIAREVQGEVIRREREEIDHMIMAEVSALRIRWPDAGRVVVRVIRFSRDGSGRIIGIDDVFESMDNRAERTRIRDLDLPLPDIENTLDQMALDTFDPVCVAANREDWPDERLRAFLTQGDFSASVACPIEGRRGRATGLLAVSVRGTLEDNPGLTGDARATAAWLSGWMDRSARVKETLEELAEVEGESDEQ